MFTEEVSYVGLAIGLVVFSATVYVIVSMIAQDVGYKMVTIKKWLHVETLALLVFVGMSISSSITGFGEKFTYVWTWQKGIFAIVWMIIPIAASWRLSRKVGQ
jgi:hypothetical protein